MSVLKRHCIREPAVKNAPAMSPLTPPVAQTYHQLSRRGRIYSSPMSTVSKQSHKFSSAHMCVCVHTRSLPHAWGFHLLATQQKYSHITTRQTASWSGRSNAHGLQKHLLRIFPVFASVALEETAQSEGLRASSAATAFTPALTARVRRPRSTAS